MDPRTIALALAYGRIGLGGALLAAPALVARLWAGRDGGRPVARLLGTGLGARDLALGVGTAVAVSRGGDARTWLRAGIAADAADVLANVRVRGDVPRLPALGVATLAAGAAVAGAWAQQQID